MLWIGIIITAQAFQTTPTAHAPAAAFGLFPAVAAYAVTVIEGALRVAGADWASVGLAAFSANGFYIYGLLALERGFVLNSMILAAMAAFVIDRLFVKAGAWALVAAALSFVGVIHSFAVDSGGIISVLGVNKAPSFTIGYLIMAAVFFLAGWFAGGERQLKTEV